MIDFFFNRRDFQMANQKTPFHTKFEVWNNLPEEMKLECIQWMDLRSRFRIRATCHTEKRLADSQKLEFKLITVLNNKNKFRLDIDEHRYSLWGRTFRKDQIETHLIPSLSFILQRASVARFYNKTDSNEFQEFLGKLDCGTSPFRIKKIFTAVTPETILFFDKCEDNSIEHLTLRCFQEGTFILDDFLQYASMNSCKHWDIINKGNPDFGEKIVRKWDEIDVDIGSKMNFFIDGTKNIEDFLPELNDFEIVQKTNRIVRIAMRNEEKHIILRNVYDDFQPFTPERVCKCVLKVVRSDFPEADYANLI